MFHKAKEVYDGDKVNSESDDAESDDGCILVETSGLEVINSFRKMRCLSSYRVLYSATVAFWGLAS